MARPRFRRNFFIYPQFQFTLILANALIIAMAFGFTFFQAWRGFHQLQQMGLDAHLPESHAYFRFVTFQAQHLYSHLAVAGVFSLVVCSLITLLLTHRLSGPIVRLRNFFAELPKKDWTRARIQFRKGDFFSDLGPVVNNALDSIEEESRSTVRRIGTKRSAS